jgi:hypothetical protein
MGYNLAIIVLRNLLFIGLYGIDTNAIHLFVLFEYKCHVHCLGMNVICLFIFFRHRCCMSISIVYTKKAMHTTSMFKQCMTFVFKQY